MNTSARPALLRVMTCGSVDDGKSTLIGRLLWESEQLPEDQRGITDLAALMDGLLDEQAQGITIDVAYRHLTLGRQRLLIADAPGHEQYTRNMVTAASDADVAMLLVDASRDITRQTRRHLFIAHLMRVPTLILLINKMDRVNFDASRYETLRQTLHGMLSTLGFMGEVHIIPISALHGDNLLTRSLRMPWYDGPPLGHALASVTSRRSEGRAAFAIQMVLRDQVGGRLYAGSVQSGCFHRDDRLCIARSGVMVRLSALQSADGPLPTAEAGSAVSFQLDQEVDLGRGDILTRVDAPLDKAAHFEATLIWMAEQDGLAGRQYDIKLASQHTVATLTQIKSKWDVEAMSKVAATSLAMNDLAVCTLATVQPLVFEPYASSRSMGSFILIDRHSQATVAAGLVQHGLRRSDNVRAQHLSIGRVDRERLNGHGARVLWFTGLSGAGKSTLANAVQSALHARGIRCYVLDGDNVRLGLNKDLGFTPADRVENIRRIAEVAALMVDAGLVVLTAFISPFREERRMARELIGAECFHEIYIATPLSVCEQRDVKGLYAKARQGLIPNMTGLDSPYEPPLHPELVIDTDRRTIEEATDQILDRFFKE